MNNSWRVGAVMQKCSNYRLRVIASERLPNRIKCKIMWDDLTDRLGKGESDLVVPLWPSGPVEPVPAEAPEAVASQLCEVARKQAKGWILSGRKSRSRVPMEKQKRATSLLLAQARLRK